MEPTTTPNDRPAVREPKASGPEAPDGFRPSVTICVCTFRRPEMLKKLLGMLRSQVTGGRFDFSVIVVDNDKDGSGADAVRDVRPGSPFPIQYFVEPERSISVARNRAVREAQGDLIAFIDDDEFPDDHWLERLVETLALSCSEGVLGPIRPHYDNVPPAWLVKSGILERKSYRTGETIGNPNDTRTGNALVVRRLFDGEDGSFDLRYGKTGGGDVDFFNRMMLKGNRFVFCDEAVVYETVPLERQKRSYYTKRAFTRGMTTAMYVPFLSRGTLKSLAAILIYTAALPVAFLLGQHQFMKYLIKDCDHLGKVLKYMGIEIVKFRPY
jgi:glycosyltransferase involved in cell wall biosynthesis